MVKILVLLFLFYPYICYGKTVVTNEVLSKISGLNSPEAIKQIQALLQDYIYEFRVPISRADNREWITCPTKPRKIGNLDDTFLYAYYDEVNQHSPIEMMEFDKDIKRWVLTVYDPKTKQFATNPKECFTCHGSAENPHPIVYSYNVWPGWEVSITTHSKHLDRVVEPGVYGQTITRARKNKETQSVSPHRIDAIDRHIAKISGYRYDLARTKNIGKHLAVMNLKTNLLQDAAIVQIILDKLGNNPEILSLLLMAATRKDIGAFNDYFLLELGKERKIIRETNDFPFMLYYKTTAFHQMFADLFESMFKDANPDLERLEVDDFAHYSLNYMSTWRAFISQLKIPEVQEKVFSKDGDKFKLSVTDGYFQDQAFLVVLSLLFWQEIPIDLLLEGWKDYQTDAPVYQEMKDLFPIRKVLNDMLFILEDEGNTKERYKRILELFKKQWAVRLSLKGSSQ